MNNGKKEYGIVRERPVARFFYKGQSHTHPVRRTVVLIETHPTYIRGYELREGAEARSFGEAPIKTYTRQRIAKVGEIDKRRVLRTKAKVDDLPKSTLQRCSIVDLVKYGV